MKQNKNSLVFACILFLRKMVTSTMARIILTGVCVAVLASCSGDHTEDTLADTSKTPSVFKDAGIYLMKEAKGTLPDGRELHPYIYFSYGDQWNIGADPIFSFGRGGKYTQDGNVLRAVRQDGAKAPLDETLFIELQVVSETELKVLKVSENFYTSFGADWKWLEEDDLLIYQEPEPEPDDVKKFGFRTGYYMVGYAETEKEICPFIEFDAETATWKSEQHTGLPCSIKGTFSCEGDTVIAKLEDEEETAFELRIITETELKVTKARDDFFPEKDYHLQEGYQWIHEGQEYYYTNWGNVDLMTTADN